MRVSLRLGATAITAAAALTALAGTAGAASVQPHVASSAVNSWQVIVPNWTHAEQAGGPRRRHRADRQARLLGGDFTKMSNHAGTTVTRNHLAAVSPSGELLPFNPSVNGRVYALASSPNGKYLYIAGQFSSVNGKPRHDLAAFRVKTGKLSPRVGNIKINGQVRGIAATTSGLYFGGSFGSVGGKKRGHVAKLVLHKQHMKLAGWAPSVNG